MASQACKEFPPQDAAVFRPSKTLALLTGRRPACEGHDGFAGVK